MMFGLGVPVIIGPMNGGINFPKSFKYMSGVVESVIQAIVRFLSHIFNILIPGKLLASRLIVANPRTKAALPFLHFGQVIQIVENAADQVIEIAVEKSVDENTQIKTRVLYVGRLVDWKAVDILFDVFADLDNSIHLDIVGDGPDMAKLMEQAADLENVTFHGWVEHATIHQVYDKADIFVLPSVRECGGAVILEAMARGVPAIATDWGGPADYIAEGTGYLIKPTSREYMVEAFKNHIQMLADDTKSRGLMGAKAKAHIVQYFLWESKIKQMVQLYHEVIAE
jgi:glycosyltransferase involved in cell wall biosynthesis